MERKRLPMEKFEINKKFKSFFYNKRILITGHTGFVGSWVTFYFLKLGCKITGISTYNSNQNNIFNILKIKKKINHHSFDLLKKNQLKKISKKKFDIVLHLAAKPLVFESFNKPDIYIKNNILSTLNLIKEIKKTKIFINFTTDKVYKNINKKNYRFKETDELGGDDPYSFSKTCSDLLTKMWSIFNPKNKIKYCNIRSGNIIGGGDWNKKRIMSDIINLLYSNKKLYVRNRYSTRPWIHVIEVCICISRLIHRLYKEKDTYTEWNIGPNNNDSKNIFWIVNQSLKISKKEYLKKNVIYLKKKKFIEKNYLKLNNQKIKNRLKFNFKIKFYERLKLTIDWFNSFYYNQSDLENLMIKQINYINKKSK